LVWTFQLTALSGTTVVVHPLVLLSVADHHARSISRNSTKRVVGVLLGQDNGKTINVANSFGIPFEEDEKDSKTWFLDHNYIEGMWEMFKKVNGQFLPWVAFAAGSNWFTRKVVL
jgi:26S proteasome regulatory subunit N8